MIIRLVDLQISFKKGREIVSFSDFNYFYGQMGAGKSTIARLIDYCLGGELMPTPALQSEFVSASLTLKIGNEDLILNREARSGGIRAQWSRRGDLFDVLIPARQAAGVVVPGTEIEVISDLLFYLSDKRTPRVRRSKIKEDSELERLSVRDLLWYCYLDQDTIDSSFFNLDDEANNFKRLKSRDVLRYIVGFHQEHVAELESRLENARIDRLQCEAGVEAIKDVLTSADLTSELEVSQLRGKLETELRQTEEAIAQIRDDVKVQRSHEMDALQKQALEIAEELSDLEQATRQLKENISKTKSHKNELLSLSTRARRAQSAREVLAGVRFVSCPECGKQLPSRVPENCPICGQLHENAETNTIDEQAIESDVQQRVVELSDLIERYELQIAKIERKCRDLRDEKAVVDSDLDRASKDYDSAYLSKALAQEKRRSAIRQQLIDIRNIEVLVQRIEDLGKKANTLVGEEQAIRSELKDARRKAEADTKNLFRLKELFLDCLLLSEIPGFRLDDKVEMVSPGFLPVISSAEAGDLATTSFGNLGSGGKKTLFKCCFAVAIHRLAVEIGATLPTFMIIDSPMKNISSSENRAQFEGFHRMLYDLSQSELKECQFILIDKELCSPPEGYERSFVSRHMKPDDANNPPLVRYYRGK